MKVLIAGQKTQSPFQQRVIIPFALFIAWMVITLLHFERRVFAELLAMRDAEIEKLRHEQGR